ncbi:PREDICTED: uncharacterized protein LOC104759636 [Camelina sativa]|uniref:Uncharacterized protein LOC104759636 n=1 Tax=Camelina sativa TaxID=90675 RepID=A0ABM0X549_CAMSA|nr:PREDICTED: uncharacterized protein LOC104759636 [Camelina sativa]
MTTSPSTGEVITNGTTPLFIVNTGNVTKLTDTNYLMWSLQIHALVDGYELAGYLDGSTIAPPPTVTTGTISIPNPYFVIWKRQDRLLFSSLLGAMSPSVQPLVSRATTTAEVWETLASTFAKPSRGHVQGIRTQLKVWTKGNKTIDEYVRGLVIRFDELAALGKPMDHEDQIEKILEGLLEDFKPVVDQIEGKGSPPTIADVHERLRNREARLLAVAAATPAPFSISANMGHSARRCHQLLSMQSATSSNSSPFTPWQPRANVAAVLDSGATHHITSDLKNLSLHQPYNGGDDLTIADGSTMPITHTGEGSDYGGPITPRQN